MVLVIDFRICRFGIGDSFSFSSIHSNWLQGVDVNHVISAASNGIDWLDNIR